jgi:hypothetical protein
MTSAERRKDIACTRCDESMLTLGRTTIKFEQILKIRGFPRGSDLQAHEDQADKTHVCADTEATKKQAFFEFINFLETHAAALNANLLPPTSRQLSSGKS